MHRHLAATLSILVLGCVPQLDEDPSLVREERVLAVRADPPEAAPGATVVLTALHADPSGPTREPALDWSACTARLPSAEPGPVASACLHAEADAIAPIGSGDSVSLTLSADACRLFGPDPPPAMSGMPSGRPVDPDSTGGYAQPVRIALADGDVALAFVRLTCGVAGANQAQSAEMRRRYHVNTHPSLASFVATFDDGSFQDVVDGVPIHVHAGGAITFQLAWPECPTLDVCGDGVCGPDEERSTCAMDCTTPVGCAGAERFARFDVASRQVVTQRESIRVSWSTTIGRFDEPRTGRAADDPLVTTENRFFAPDAPTTGWIGIVVRDDRGGTSWVGTVVIVDP